MLADAGDDDGSSLAVGLFHHQLAHLVAIHIVEVTDGFVG